MTPGSYTWSNPDHLKLYINEAVKKICENLCAYDALDDGELIRNVFEMARYVRALSPEISLYPAKIAELIYKNSSDEYREWIDEDFFVESFQASWMRVRTIPGEDIFGSALKWANVNPISLDKEHQGGASKGFRRFISFCAGMCMTVGKSRIKLPCREVANALKMNKETISSYRQHATELGYLTIIKTHSYQPNGKGEATLFQFHIEKWPLLESQLKAKSVIEK